MCAIFGIGLFNGHKLTDTTLLKNLVNELFLQSEPRGKDASGIAISTRSSVTVVKKNITASKFINTEPYVTAMNAIDLVNTNDRFMSIIGHTRFQTKGSHTNNDNNHPIITNNIVGIHNGCISNDDKLFNDHKADITRKGQVDSEIIFRLINYHHFTKYTNMASAIDLTTKSLTGSFACALINKKQTGRIWLFRNQNPTDIMLLPKLGLVVFSTSYSYVRNALSKVGIELGKDVSYHGYSAKCIDLVHNKISKFEILKHTKTTCYDYEGLYQ